MNVAPSSEIIFDYDLLLYEMPGWYEFIWFDWGQSIVAKILVRRVARKMARYNTRLQRRRYPTETTQDEADGGSRSPDN